MLRPPQDGQREQRIRHAQLQGRTLVTLIQAQIEAERLTKQARRIVNAYQEQLDRDLRNERNAIQFVEEVEQARAMRAAGFKYRDIAAALRCSISLAYDRAARVLEAV